MLHGIRIETVIFRASVLIVLLIAGCTFLPLSASAHGGGMSLTATTTAYLIDIEYADVSIVAGEPGRFDFKLADIATNEPVYFGQVWVRITKENEIVSGDTVFSGSIAKSSYGSTGMSIAMPSSGSYEILVRFGNGDDTIVESTIPFTVQAVVDKNNGAFNRNFFLGFLVGSVIAFCIAMMLHKRKTQATQTD